MHAPLTPRPAEAGDGRAPALLCSVTLVGAIMATYWGSLSGPFLYDDLDSIPNNRSLAHLSTAFRPPSGATVSGRPILNASFALNHAVSGLDPWGYHAVNLAIHAAAALLLFAILRRTLAFAAVGARTASDGLWISFAGALLWALHPLQVESVAYTAQRAESLVGLFYLLTLYAFIRGAQAAPASAFWKAVSVGACLLGMGTKEVMATAPLMVLLYDRTFVSGSFRRALAGSRALYAAYAACWVPLAFLVAHGDGRGGSAGFGSGVPWWAYLMTQFTAVIRYLGLCVWPRPLVGDYGRILAGDPLEVALCALLVLSLAAASWVLLRKGNALGFLGAWVLVILAPSSSVIPVSTEIMALHRMYLPLAAVMVLAVLVLDAWAGRRLMLAAAVALAVGLAVLTVRRIRVYQSPLAFWSDVTRKVPGNAGAWNNLGLILAESGDRKGAIEDYYRALAIAPAYAYAHNNLGQSFVATGHAEDAVGQFEKALVYREDDPSIHFNLANALALSKRWLAAAAEYREVLKLDPDRMDALDDLGDAMVKAGNLPEAARVYQGAVAKWPEFADARVNFGNVLAELGRLPEAAAELKEALRLQPGAADVHNNLGSVFAEMGDLAQARAQFEEALRIRPDYSEARDNLKRAEALGQAQAPK